MKFDPEELKADAVKAKSHNKITLFELVKMGEEMQRLQDCMTSSEEYLANLKQEYNKIAEVQLPEAMQMMGLKFFGLADGYEINIQQVVSTKIKPEQQEAAYQWLREQGHDDIIKNEVKVVFGRGEGEQAAWLAGNISAIIHDEGPIPGKEAGMVISEQTIHPQTLKAFVTTQLEAGTEFPAELFGLYVGKIAKLVKPKKRK